MVQVVVVDQNFVELLVMVVKVAVDEEVVVAAAKVKMDILILVVVEVVWEDILVF
jgi:hypothetical protein